MAKSIDQELQLNNCGNSTRPSAKHSCILLIRSSVSKLPHIYPLDAGSPRFMLSKSSVSGRWKTTKGRHVNAKKATAMLGSRKGYLDRVQERGKHGSMRCKEVPLKSNENVVPRTTV